jgi:hypothetical protein
MQKTFLNYELHFAIIEGLTEEDLNEVFSRLQKGAPLTASVARRGQYMKQLTALKTALDSPVWDKIGLKQSERETVLMQLVNSLTGNESFDSQILVENFVNWNMEQSLIEKINHGLENLDSVLFEYSQDDQKGQSEFKKSLRKIHIEAILYSLIVENDVTDEMDSLIVYQNIRTFFGMMRDERTIEKINYNDSCSNGTSSESAVKNRHDTMRRVIIGTFQRPIVIEKTVPLKKPSEVKSQEKKNKRGHSEKELMEHAEAISIPVQ